jgi:hypothetical protein
MKRYLLFALFALPLCAQSVEVEYRRVSSEEVYKWAKFSPVPGPIDTRERLDVWLRSKDANVLAFRVTVRYQVRDSVTAESCIVPNHVEHGGVCRVKLSDPSAKILSVTYGRLVEQESSDVPIS